MHYAVEDHVRIRPHRATGRKAFTGRVIAIRREHGIVQYVIANDDPDAHGYWATLREMEPLF